MDKENNLQCLNTLKEMILDERRIVTYVSLSKEMCVHVNESKSLLSQIIEDLRKTNAGIQLNVNYIISGLLDSNKALTAVCNETELSVLKNKFKTIFYQHLYSVSIGKTSADNVSFMAINKFEDFPLCTGLIKSNSCVKRSPQEIGNLKSNSQETVNSEQKKVVPDQRKVKEENKKGTNWLIEKKQVVKIQESKSEPIIKTEIPSPKKEATTTISQNSNLLKTDRKNAKTQKGIAGFFNQPAKTSSKNKVVNGTKTNDQKYEEQDIKDDFNIKVEKMDADEDLVNDESPTKYSRKDPGKLKNNSNKNGNKSLNQIKKNAKVDKKRKRVLRVSDSESDDEKNDPFIQEPEVNREESEDEIPPTPLVNTVKITSGIVNPKKKRKIVDKTYTDEDGYILTKKEEVYESFSENEEELQVKENIQHLNKVKNEASPTEKKNSSKNGKKKIASPQKGKQSTLMSFFKKV